MSFYTCALHRQRVSEPQVIDKAPIAFSLRLSSLHISLLSQGGSCRKLWCVIVWRHALCRHKLAPVQGPNAGHSTPGSDGDEAGAASGCSWLSRYEGSLQKPSISGSAAPRSTVQLMAGAVSQNTNREGGTASRPRCPQAAALFALLCSDCSSLTRLSSPSPPPFFSSFFPEPSVALKLSQ